jgi:hypothetical protein
MEWGGAGGQLLLDHGDRMDGMPELGVEGQGQSFYLAGQDYGVTTGTGGRLRALGWTRYFDYDSNTAAASKAMAVGGMYPIGRTAEVVRVTIDGGAGADVVWDLRNVTLLAAVPRVEVVGSGGRCVVMFRAQGGAAVPVSGLVYEAGHPVGWLLEAMEDIDVACEDL